MRVTACGQQSIRYGWNAGIDGKSRTPKPGEHKTVQARILEYAEYIGWTIVPREEAEQRRSFDSEAVPRDRAKGASLFFDEAIKSCQALPLLFIMHLYRFEISSNRIVGRMRHGRINNATYSLHKKAPEGNGAEAIRSVR